ncbi:hypothetical protein BDI4_450026 [Burkholderia diffusa]|nr:hypothetical protein BDI4_450026 [Burkholderia diffusa]
MSNFFIFNVYQHQFRQILAKSHQRSIISVFHIATHARQTTPAPLSPNGNNSVISIRKIQTNVPSLFFRLTLRHDAKLVNQTTWLFHYAMKIMYRLTPLTR